MSSVKIPAADPKVTPAQLREVGLFGALSDDFLEHLAGTLSVQRYTVGDVIFREGDPAREMYVVLDGEIEVLKKSRRGRETRVAILGPNDCFGEMSIIDMQPRSATVRAVGSSRLLRISTEEMDALYRHDLKSYTLIVLNIARDLSRRLRVADGLLADFTMNVLDEYATSASGKAS
ncbi:MAG: cyclic nucleotide-binding domain-containing protein [Labilithrix sp.]|nr:cyclic nucleotide-binding domain-containing protein [Labilithrix sp.]MCW5810440.1 cyclic nucleotide-binding domain-containing protein [Labilithrix sp.]